MLRALALALLIPAVASAQTSARVEGARGPIYPGPALKLPLSFSGAPFDCLGATSCVYWNGSALVDSAGLTWTQNGTVPQVAANALPTTASTGAAGPFSDANYYSSGTGSDPLDSTGDRFGCVAFVPAAADLAGGKMLVANGSSGIAGYWIEINASPTFVFRSNTPALVSAIPATPVVANGLNVGCFWRSATAISAKANLGATTTNAAAGTEVAGTAYVLKTGRAETAGGSFNGQILAVVQGLGACPPAPPPYAASCEGWATYQMTRSFGAVSTLDGGVAVARTTTNGVATNEVNGIVWNVPNNVPRVTANGLLVERASTNYILNNRTHPKTAEAYTHSSTGAYVAWHTGTGTMTVAAGTATVTGLSCTAVAAGTLCPYTVTVAGTMLITTTAGTIAAQAEPGSTRTSEIVTAGVAATRNADVPTIAWPAMLDINRWCVKATVTPTASWVKDTYLWSVGNWGSARSARFYITSASQLSFGLYDDTPTLRAAVYVHSMAPGSTHALTACNNSGTLAVYIDGAQVATSSTGGTGTWNASPTSLWIGTNNGGTLNEDGFSRNVTVCKSGSASLCR